MVDYPIFVFLQFYNQKNKKKAQAELFCHTKAQKNADQTPSTQTQQSTLLASFGVYLSDKKGTMLEVTTVSLPLPQPSILSHPIHMLADVCIMAPVLLFMGRLLGASYLQPESQQQNSNRKQKKTRGHSPV